jgi:hypothetical protein
MQIPRPIPPRSVVRIKHLWSQAPEQGDEIGDSFRIGYYSKKQGLDCIWLVDNMGEYGATADHAWLEEHFDVVEISDEDDFFGDLRPILPAISEDKPA